MDALVIANIDEATSASAFLKSQREQMEEAYGNMNSYLYQGQQASNSYMQMKQRVPMVMEFYLTPEELYTVEMYINPQKMTFSHTKLIGKQVTRGGIFFHHYGEDAPKLTIQGNTGLSGMKGIEQLEKIFNYSGTLLRYQDVGINKINNGIAEPREIISLDDVIAQFDTTIRNTTEQQISITETAESLFKKSNVVFETGEGLYSKAKAAYMVGLNLNLLNNAVDWSNKLAQLKSVIVKANQIMSGQSASFKDIYYIVLDLCNKETGFQDPSLDVMAFQIAYRMYSDQVGEVEESLSASVDTTKLTIDMFVSQENSSQNNNTNANASVQSSPSNLVNVYKCVNYGKMYSSPSFGKGSNVLSELYEDGEFTAFVDENIQNNWAKHLTGGYAMINTPPNTKQVLRNGILNSTDTEHTIKLSELHLCVDPKKGYVKENWAKDGNNYHLFYPGGYFTYTETTEASHMTWFKHETLGYWIPSGIYQDGEYYRILANNNESKILELQYENCYVYTAIRDDIKLYNAPNTESDYEKDEQGKPKFLCKGGKFTAQKVENGWLQHLKGKWCQLTTNGQPNFIEGYVPKGSEMLPDGATVSGENHMPKILTSNNDITLEVQKSITDCTNAFQQYLSDIRVWNKNSVVKRFEIENGLADIQEDLTDEWLPRLVFIYFEDRVFLGHFDTFSYDRVAETENITYNMAFTIQRIISVTSISPKRFEQSRTEYLNELGSSDYSVYRESLEYFAEQYALGNDLPLKIEILRTKCKYYYESAIARYSGENNGKVTEERIKSITAHHERCLQCSVYNGVQQLTHNTPIYGNALDLNYDQYIYFFTLGLIEENEIFKMPLEDLGMLDGISQVSTAQRQLNIERRIDGQFITPAMLQQDWCLAKYNDIIIPELQRTNSIWTNESNMGYVDERRASAEYEAMKANNQVGKMTLKDYNKSISDNRSQQLFEHAQNLILSVGARYANNSDFRQIYNNWLYRSNSTAGQYSQIKNGYKDKDAKITATINSKEVYERTLILKYNNKDYTVNVLNFSPTAKQNYAPIRYVLENILKCQCGWNAQKKRAICITNNKEILLDIETYLHTTTDSKTNKTTTVAYSPISVLLQYLNIDYKVTKEGSEATVRKEGITHIQSEPTEATIKLFEDSKVDVQQQEEENRTAKTSTSKETAQQKANEEKEKEKQDLINHNIIEKEDEEDRPDTFKIKNANDDSLSNNVLVLYPNERYVLTIQGIIQEQGYGFQYVIQKNRNGNEVIKHVEIKKSTNTDTYKKLVVVAANSVGTQILSLYRQQNARTKNRIDLTVIVVAAESDKSEAIVEDKKQTKQEKTSTAPFDIYAKQQLDGNGREIKPIAKTNDDHYPYKLYVGDRLRFAIQSNSQPIGSYVNATDNIEVTIDDIGTSATIKAIHTGRSGTAAKFSVEFKAKSNSSTRIIRGKILTD